jgi:NADPH-dependent ferric siderophore reductase
MRYQRPRRRQMLTLTVQARERITPNFMSITLGGADVQHLDHCGYDQAGRLFFGATLPTSTNWMLQYTLQPALRRTRVRWYTIRRFHPQTAAFDIEVSLHASDGPAAPGTSWALTAEPGDQVAFLDEGYSYAPTAGATWQLLVGDESALPAILAILERSGTTLPAEVFLEVPTGDDVRGEITTPGDTTIHWLPRNDPAMKPGTLALQAVKDAKLRPGPFYTWTAGESALPTGLRRHLVNDREIPRSQVAFQGYWRHGRASL